MRIRFALVLLAGLLVLAGCGGGGKKSAATTTTAAKTTTAAAAAKTTTAAAALSGVASAANCRELGDLGTRFSAALTGASQKADVKKVAELLREFAAKTPKEIRPDFKLLADDYGKLADALGSFKAGSAPDPQALARLQQVSSEIDTTKLSQASQRIAGWLQKNCRP